MTISVKEARKALPQYRMVFKAATGRDTTADDDSLIEAIQGLPETYDESDIQAAFEQAESGNGADDTDADDTVADDKPADDVTDEQAAKANVSAAHRKANAIKAAEKAVADKVLQALFHDTVIAGELVKRGPVLAVVELLRIHGGDWQKVVPCSFDDYPVVDSPWVGEQGNSDKYPTYSTSAKGKRITSEGSWWNDYADTMPDAKAAIEALSAIALADAGDPKATEPYRTMGKTLRATEKRLHTDRRNAIRATVKKAARVRARMLEIVRDFPAVTTGFLSVKNKDKTVTLARTTSPIYISDKENPMVGEGFSVTGYLGLNLVKAQQDGGTYDAVVTSTTKAASTPTALPKIEGVEMLEQYLAEVTAWIDDKANGAAFAKALAAKDSDDFVVTIGDLFTGLDSTKGRWLARYTRLKNAENEKAEKEAASA